MIDPIVPANLSPDVMQSSIPPPENMVPPRPKVPQDVRAFVDKWWKETTNVPDHDAAVKAARESQKTLFPAWFDRSDPFRGMKQFETRTRQDDRRVRVQLAYKNVLQTVALTVPDDHSFKWDAIPQVGADQGIADPATMQLAATLVPVTRQYCEETGWQEVVQGWVQDACQYRLSVMKVTFDKDFVKDTIKIHAEGKDEQQMIERLRVLVEDYGRRRFTKFDARFQEILDLQESLHIDGDIMKLWTGLRVELVPIDCFRFDPAIRGYEQIYSASWMSHDVRMSVDEIREKYPYKLHPDGTWEGVHPDDLFVGQQNDRTSNSSYGVAEYGSVKEKGKGPSPQWDSAAERDRLTVREIWCKKLGRVFVIVEGMGYPAASWSPEKTPAQWYPFRCLRLNRVTGQVYGFSDVELQSEIQHRINRKRSDEERGRWLSLPRGIYNTQGIDQNEVNKMRDHNPGEWKGINLGGAKSIKEVMEFQQFQFNPEWFDTSKDEQEMRMMSSLPQQMMGMTGGSTKFSSEVEAGMQGAAIASSARGTIVRRALEGAYDMIAEILLQELTPEEALGIAGPAGFWPHVYGDAEGHKLKQEMEQQAQQKVQQQMQMMEAQQQMQQLQAMQQGLPPQPPIPPPPQTLVDQAIAEATKELSLQTFGWEEPVTRESLFRRMKCRVTVAMNTASDREQRISATQSIFGALQMGSQAAASMTQSGMAVGEVCKFNPKPLLSAVKTLFNGDDEIKEMFQMVPIPMMPGAMAAGPGQAAPGLPPEVAGAAQQSSTGQETTGVNAAPTASKDTAVQPVQSHSGKV